MQDNWDLFQCVHEVMDHFGDKLPTLLQPNPIYHTEDTGLVLLFLGTECTYSIITICVISTLFIEGTECIFSCGMCTVYIYVWFIIVRRAHFVSTVLLL